jgi:hypothetical protein
MNIEEFFLNSFVVHRRTFLKFIQTHRYTCDAALLNPQVGRSHTHDLSSYTSPKSSWKWLLYFTFGKYAHAINLEKFPLILREIGLRTFVNLVVKHLVSQSMKFKNNQHLILFLSISPFSLSQFWGLRCQATCPLNSRNPIYRNSDAIASF